MINHTTSSAGAVTLAVLGAASMALVAPAHAQPTVDSSSWAGAVGNTAVTTTGFLGYGYVGVDAAQFRGMFGGTSDIDVHNNTAFGSVYEYNEDTTFGNTKLLTTVGGTYTNVTLSEGSPVDSRSGADGYSFDGIPTYGLIGGFAGNEQDIYTLTFNDLGVGTFAITVYTGHTNTGRKLDMDYNLAGVTGTTATGQTLLGTEPIVTVGELNGGAAGGFLTYNITVTTTAATDDLSLTFGSISGSSGNAILAGYTVSGNVTYTSAPLWTAGYPKADTATASGFTVRASINEAGTAYYVVVADSSTAPTTADVLAGTGNGGAPALDAGPIVLSAAGTEATAVVTGLPAGTAYDVYLVAQDDEGTPNVQDATTLIEVTTATPATTDPSWTAGYPKADTATASGFTVRASINEAGTAYYVVLANGSTAPTTAEVVAGTGSGGATAAASGSIALAADVEGSTALKNLDPATTYDVYFVANGSAGNLETAVREVADKTTLAAGPVSRVRVIILSGQSNADGRANSNGLSTSPVHLLLPQRDVDLYEASLIDLLPVNDQFGPEITLGRGLADSISSGTTERVAIIKYARGGKSLEVDFAPGGDGTTAGDGSQYVNLQNVVTAGMSALAAAYPSASIEIEGMLWVQGERDIVDGNESLYEGNLTDFIADVRATYGTNLPFIISRLSSGTTYSEASKTTMRAAQNNVAAADPYAEIVDTDSFSLSNDRVHYNADGQQDLGYAAAAALLPYLIGYDSWPGGLSFEGDANLDGVPDGLAWLLGAPGPAADARGLLPVATVSDGDLTLDFNCLNVASRGGAQVFVEYSRDLGVTDPWTSQQVPETTGTVDGVEFVITPDGDLNGVQVTIPASAATPGSSLFVRINGGGAP